VARGARTEIERRIVTGELPGGLILDEALAAELVVDSESVHEGLICLLADGLVRAVPGGGFSVTPVDELELRAANHGNVPRRLPDLIDRF
jgi:DNA-binding GntR family transcriptional regulator